MSEEQSSRKKIKLSHHADAAGEEKNEQLNKEKIESLFSEQGQVNSTSIESSDDEERSIGDEGAPDSEASSSVTAATFRPLIRGFSRQPLREHTSFFSMFGSVDGGQQQKHADITLECFEEEKDDHPPLQLSAPTLRSRPSARLSFAQNTFPNNQTVFKEMPPPPARPPKRKSGASAPLSYSPEESTEIVGQSVESVSSRKAT